MQRSANNVIELAIKVTNAPPPTRLDVPPQAYAAEILHLISRMLQKDPSLRPSTVEIIRMPFFYKYTEILASRLDSQCGKKVLSTPQCQVNTPPPSFRPL